MSQQVRVERSLKFAGAANNEANVEGNLLEKKCHFSDNFTNVTLDSNKWATSVPGTSDSIAISEVAGGSVLFTTGTVDDDSCMMASAIIFSGTKKAVCEARISITDVSGTALFVGFSDAKSESNNSIAIHYAADALTTVASDAAGFVIDADSATVGASSLMCCSVKANSDTTPVDTAITWADGATYNLRVELDGTTAKFFVDGVQKAAIASSVTAATLLCFTIQAMTRANDGSNTVYGYRTDVWQDE